MMIVPELMEVRRAVALGILCSALEAETMAASALHLVTRALVFLNPSPALGALPHILARHRARLAADFAVEL